MSKTIGVILALQDKCSPQLTKIADKLGITEKEAKKVHNQVNKLSKEIGSKLKPACSAVAVGITALAGASAMMINQAVEAGDRIDKMSQKMQMSRQTFQELDYVFSQNGADISMMQTGMSNLAKAMEGARGGAKANVKTFQALGISLKDNNGQLKTSETVMFEAISKLQKMPESAKKTALSLQLFGKSATELQPLLNGNAKSVDELRKKFKDLGMGMSDEQVDSAVKFKDTMDTIQRTFAGLVNQIGASLLPSFQSLADKLVNNIPRIKATVTPVLSGIIKATSFLIDHFDALTVVGGVVVNAFIAFNVIKGVIVTMQILRAAIQAVSIAQGVWNALMLVNPIGVWATIIGVVVSAVILLWKNWDKVTSAVKKAVDAMKSFVGIKDKSNVSTPDNKIKKHASGTAYSQGGLALVGERGPELVNLPTGAKVINSYDTQKTLGSNIVINVNIGGNLWGTQAFLNEMKQQLGRELVVAMARG